MVVPLQLRLVDHGHFAKDEGVPEVAWGKWIPRMALLNGVRLHLKELKCRVLVVKKLIDGIGFKNPFQLLQSQCQLPHHSLVILNLLSNADYRSLLGGVGYQPLVYQIFQILVDAVFGIGLLSLEKGFGGELLHTHFV